MSSDKTELVALTLHTSHCCSEDSAVIHQCVLTYMEQLLLNHINTICMHSSSAVRGTPCHYNSLMNCYCTYVNQSWCPLCVCKRRTTDMGRLSSTLHTDKTLKGSINNKQISSFDKQLIQSINVTRDHHFFKGTD